MTSKTLSAMLAIKFLQEWGVSDAEEHQGCKENRLVNEVNGERVSP